jgi:hypothetical protein
MSDWESLFQYRNQRFPLKYQECNRLGHDFEVESYKWFRYGWRWPWRNRMWKVCRGCGIVQLLPKGER